MFDLAYKQGRHFLECDAHADAVRLRNRMHKIRASERKAREKEIEGRPLETNDTVLDRLVLLIPEGSGTLEVAVSEAVDLSFVKTLQPDGTLAPTFPAADTPQDEESLI